MDVTSRCAYSYGEDPPKHALSSREGWELRARIRGGGRVVKRSIRGGDNHGVANGHNRIPDAGSGEEFQPQITLMTRIGELLGLKPQSGLLFIRAISAIRGQTPFSAPRTAVISSGKQPFDE